MTTQDAMKVLTSPPSFSAPEGGFALDVSRIGWQAEAIAHLLTEDKGGEAPMAAAHREMQRLEAGAIKNPDENRKVTHFTDRQSYPETGLYRDVEQFAEEIRRAPHIDAVVMNGIGGSALGPQLMQLAMKGPYWNEQSAEARNGYPRIYFLDNTDPAGVRDVCRAVDLKKTIVVSVSKSGGTQETRNNLLALEKLYDDAGIPFAPRAVAVTMADSTLDERARDAGWRKRFHMPESIGGRTSVTHVVGHVPAALAGIGFASFLDGATRMDEWTRAPELVDNPAYQLAAAWYAAGNGTGERNMVVVPYADRLVLFARYLQQLVMESLGKEQDRDGNVVHQGLTVYGNKGGTDAHAYIQQLQEGKDDFFLTFVEILKDAAQFPAEGGLTMGDYLHAFKEGLRAALQSKGRPSIDIVIDELNESSLGMLIALFERAVAVYAELVHINAFNQPGVEAYKSASQEVNTINVRLQSWLRDPDRRPVKGTAHDITAQAGLDGHEADVQALLAKFAVNDRTFAGAAVTRTFSSGQWTYAVGRADSQTADGTQ